MRLSWVIILFTAGPLLALTPPPPYFENAVQDAQGVIWAFSRAEYNHVYRYDGKEWTGLSGPFNSEQSAMPAFVVRMTDGTVACIWRVEPKTVGVTIQSDRAVRLLGTCDGDIPGSGLTVQPFADSQNRLWITGESPDIYRADAKGVVKVHEITPDEFGDSGKRRDGYNQVHAVEDGHGRIWAWSDRRASNYASLRGVLIFTGDKCELHDAFSTIKGKRVIAIAKADDKHMWLAASDDGIYRIDIDTFAAEREPDPAPKALCCVHELHVEGDDLYAIESLPVFKDTLWRKHAGVWKQLMPQFDQHPFSFIPRSWLPIKEGMLVESYQAGPWFIPREGEPAQFSWRTGFPMENVHALARFDDGTFFAIGSNDALFHGPLTLPPREKPETERCVQLDTDREWSIDPAGHLWILSRDKPPVLKEWDGTQWNPHPIPGATDRLSSSSVMADEEGRIWPLPQGTKQAVSIFDTRAGTWLSFPGMDEAFLGLKKRPPHFLHDRWFLTPQYSADQKRIARRIGVTEVTYYDGKTWQKWERNAITGLKESDGAVGVPWFDANGALRVNTRPKSSWKMSDGKWASVPYESHFPADIWSEGHNNDPRPVPPEGAVTRQTESIAIDNLGVTWLQWQNRLYKCVPGVCIPVFGDDEINPFSVRRLIQEVFIDKSGNAFIKTASSAMGWFMIKPKSSTPHTTITIESTGKDSVTARLDAHSTAPVDFHWQLDQAPVEVTKETTLVLKSLPNGAHELKVFASDDQLQMESAPTVAKFNTHIDPKAQLAGLIAQLSGPDYGARKAAVQALALQPAQATAALRKARMKADESTQWWIDAALQEIDSRSTAVSSRTDR